MGTERFPKKGKMTAMGRKDEPVTHERLPNMYAKPNVGTVPTLERGYMLDNYGKTGEKRGREGPGDLSAELRTSTYIMGAFRKPGTGR